jgi:hypothetical protein
MGAEHDIEPGTILEESGLNVACGCAESYSSLRFRNSLFEPCRFCGHELQHHLAFKLDERDHALFDYAPCSRVVVRRREVRA